MSVSVVKITEPIGVNKKTKNVNIYAASAVGAAAGVALRQFTPVYKNEMDSVFFGEAERIRQNSIKHAKKDIITEIRSEAAKNKSNPALQLFLDRVTSVNMLNKASETKNTTLRTEALNLANVTKQKIKEAPVAVKEEIKLLTEGVINKVKAARFLSEDAIKTAVKHHRPVSAFLLPGVALGALAGFVYNVVGAISED